MKALITGGAGFIGSHIAKKLIDNNIDVHIIDNLSTGDLGNIPFVPKNNIHIKDISDYEYIESIFQKNGFTYVIHLAAMVSVVETIEKPIQSNRVNIDASINLLNLIKEYNPNIKKVVFASSAAVYGKLDGLPKSVDSLIEPLSPYAIQKYASEQYTKIYNDLYNIPTVSLRFFNIYGPRQNPKSDYSGVLSILNQRFLEKQKFTFFGDGEQTRDFVYINDLVQAFWLVLNSDEVNGEIFNVGTGRQTTLNEIFEVFQKNYNYSIPYEYEDERKGDIKYSYADITKLEKIGYSPSYTINEGIREYLRYNKNNLNEG
ncbi:NAD-dependent dehydratase [Staphylococcus cohnii]|uniref:NAD-dependent epimerase/dehydratase family protein n=1 Tax=Staphylococcus cohnii TaxID=29382 RepID=UPI000D1BB217|nr:NAD-dependent epimerase/dehydratase family protein [Staphylococcus cohnii]PTF23081.1 NAD-dependent dehydratase [Staphylococcus cohnii]PTF25491.1 NAD-dependent dehydratase [Staphylococcus cohnii]PTG46930.1 NAD-dependent dehydratase [Staphylococcus cohnii]RIL86567.1 NAD-dependent epimerase/dehydratase family protein [Staphylococcus cohnii]